MFEKMSTSMNELLTGQRVYIPLIRELARIKLQLCASN